MSVKAFLVSCLTIAGLCLSGLALAELSTSELKARADWAHKRAIQKDASSGLSTLEDLLVLGKGDPEGETYVRLRLYQTRNELALGDPAHYEAIIAAHDVFEASGEPLHDPYRGAVLTALARAHVGMKEDAAAMELLRKAASENGNTATLSTESRIKTQFYKLLLETGRNEDLLDDYVLFEIYGEFSLDPADDVDIALWRTRAHLNLGQYHEAIEPLAEYLFEKRELVDEATRMEADRIAANYGCEAGDACLAQGDVRGAVTAYAMVKGPFQGPAGALPAPYAGLESTTLMGVPITSVVDYINKQFTDISARDKVQIITALGDVHRLRNRWSDAAIAYEEALKESPIEAQEADLYEGLGNCRLKIGPLDEALENYLEAYSRRVGDEALIRIAEKVVTLYVIDERALDGLAWTSEAGLPNPIAKAMEGRLTYALGDIAEATAQFTEAGEMAEDPETRRFIGFAWVDAAVRSGPLHLVDDAIRKAVELGANRAGVNWRVMDAANDMGVHDSNYTRAIGLYEAIIQEAEQNDVLLLAKQHKGAYLVLTGHVAEGHQIYREIVSATPLDDSWLGYPHYYAACALASAHLGKNEIEEAEELYQSCVVKYETGWNKGAGNALVGLAEIAYRRKGDLNAAEEYLLKAIHEVGGEQPEPKDRAMLLLAEVYAHQERRDESYALLVELVKSTDEGIAAEARKRLGW